MKTLCEQLNELTRSRVNPEEEDILEEIENVLVERDFYELKLRVTSNSGFTHFKMGALDMHGIHFELTHYDDRNRYVNFDLEVREGQLRSRIRKGTREIASSKSVDIRSKRPFDLAKEMASILYDNRV